MTNHELHVKLWTCLAEHPELGKQATVDLLGLPETPCDCFACEEAKVRSCNGNSICRYCPLDWTGGWCMGRKSEYRAWLDAKDPEEKSRLALAIANLPWKE